MDYTQKQYYTMVIEDIGHGFGIGCGGGGIIYFI